MPLLTLRAPGNGAGQLASLADDRGAASLYSHSGKTMAPDSDHWQDDFFSNTWATVGGELIPDAQTVSEANAIEALFGLGAGARVLDMPCGHGRLSIEFALRGYSVTGVEKYAGTLAEAQRRAHERGAVATLLSGDMRNVTWDNSQVFDHAICMFGSFGYFGEQGELDQLRSTHAALRPGGTLLLEVIPIEGLASSFMPKAWQRVGSAIVLQERSYEFESGLLRSAWTVVQNGVEQRAESKMQIYSCAGLVSMLENAGFTKVELFGGLEGRPYRFGDLRACCVATS